MQTKVRAAVISGHVFVDSKELAAHLRFLASVARSDLRAGLLHAAAEVERFEAETRRN